MHSCQYKCRKLRVTTQHLLHPSGSKAATSHWPPHVIGKEKKSKSHFPRLGIEPGPLAQRPTLYYVAIEASFYSDVVECRTLNLADRIRSSVRKNVIWIFSPFLLHVHPPVCVCPGGGRGEGVEPVLLHRLGPSI